MCEVLKVYVHPVHSDYLVITEETEDLNIDELPQFLCYSKRLMVKYTT